MSRIAVQPSELSWFITYELEKAGVDLASAKVFKSDVWDYFKAIDRGLPTRGPDAEVKATRYTVVDEKSGRTLLAEERRAIFSGDANAQAAQLDAMALVPFVGPAAQIFNGLNAKHAARSAIDQARIMGHKHLAMGIANMVADIMLVPTGGTSYFARLGVNAAVLAADVYDARNPHEGVKLVDIT